MSIQCIDKRNTFERPQAVSLWKLKWLAIETQPSGAGGRAEEVPKCSDVSAWAGIADQCSIRLEGREFEHQDAGCVELVGVHNGAAAKR
jgi:hypothetical protein